ncbi:unnamed protein product [Ceutorhynchus assimilis]|uniref:Uncharacterized protein n=1 Tax=Ceutorhynchus assimilis TaxID=467358 RepID=A0A9N9QHW6_9CUCU|nr:unnamed protein product [Ceutorhynchus assimilis]
MGTWYARTFSLLTIGSIDVKRNPIPLAGFEKAIRELIFFYCFRKFTKSPMESYIRGLEKAYNFQNLDISSNCEYIIVVVFV